MHEKRARSNTPTTTSSTRTENVAATNPLAVGEGSGSGASTTTAGGLGGYLVMASPPSHHESEALARLKRANLTLRERKNEERMRSGATSSDLPSFAPAHLHVSPRRPSAAEPADTTEPSTRPRASSTEKKEKKEKKEKEKSTRKWKKKGGVEAAQHKKAPVEEWRPKEVAKWLQAIELGDYAKAARKKKVDGAQLVLVVDTILSTSPAADHHADGGVVLAALGVKKLGHLKRLQRELRQAMLDSNGGDDGGENEDGDDNDDDGAEECEEERRKHKAAAAVGKLLIPRGHSAPITVSASLPAASSPNRLRRLVHNLSGSSTTPSSLSSSPSATSSSPSSPSSLSAPSSVSFPAIDSDSDSFLTPALSLAPPPSSPAAGDGRPRTRSKLIERLAIGMPRSRSAESPLPLAPTSTSTSTSSSALSGSTSLGRSGSGFGFGGTGSCPLPAVVSPPLSPSDKRPSNSANFIAVAHGTSTLFDGDDESLGSTISTISTSSSSSSSSSSANNNLGATFSFSFPSSSSSHSASSISATWDASPSSCTSLAFCSMFGEVAIKCVVDDDISLVRLNLETDFSLSGLHRYTFTLFVIFTVALM